MIPAERGETVESASADSVRSFLRLIAREDLAVLDEGQRLTDLVGVDGGNDLGQLVAELCDSVAGEERPQGVGIGEALLGTGGQD